MIAGHHRPLRCAVYMRTLRETAADPAFGSITAQQEACFGYVASQHHLSWLPASVSNDDSGISGATIERPALQLILQDIEAGRVDMVVVYKLDRLSRSLVHFSNLMRSFDSHQVALVNLDALWDLLMSSIQRKLLRQLVERVTVGADMVSVNVSPDFFVKVALDLLKGRTPQPVRNKQT
jgi:DNA invertase Pin-like site-specific DNA recombinase